MYLFTLTHTFTLAHSHTEHYFFNKCHTCKLPKLNLFHYFRQVELTDPFCLFSLLNRQPKKDPHAPDRLVYLRETNNFVDPNFTFNCLFEFKRRKDYGKRESGSNYGASHGRAKQGMVTKGRIKSKT